MRRFNNSGCGAAIGVGAMTGCDGYEGTATGAMKPWFSLLSGDYHVRMSENKVYSNEIAI